MLQMSVWLLVLRTGLWDFLADARLRRGLTIARCSRQGGLAIGRLTQRALQGVVGAEARLYRRTWVIMGWLRITIVCNYIRSQNGQWSWLTGYWV